MLFTPPSLHLHSHRHTTAPTSDAAAAAAATAAAAVVPATVSSATASATTTGAIPRSEKWGLKHGMARPKRHRLVGHGTRQVSPNRPHSDPLPVLSSLLFKEFHPL